MSRATTLASALAATLVTAIALPLTAWSAVQPNIIFILVDDLGIGDLGSYGQEQIQTPILDEMAARGVRFTNFYAGGPTCAPSRDSLLTGRHTGHTTNRNDHHYPLKESDITVGEVLEGAGYATAAIGKWGLGDVGTSGHPNRRGFDYFYGYLDARHAHNYWPDHLFENEERVELNNEVWHFEEEEAQIAAETNVYAPALLLEKSLEFIRANHRQPFFLYFAPNLVHANTEFSMGVMDGMVAHNYFKQDWPREQQYYATMVSILDKQLGEIVGLLRKLHILEDTVIFFSSDNGPHAEGGQDPEFFGSSGGLRGRKMSMYDGGLRVPLLAVWQGKTQPGLVNDGLWAHWDFLATAAELAGVRPPSDNDGRSMAPLLRGEETPGHEFLYWEDYNVSSQQAVRLGKWKAIRVGLSDDMELYDMEVDPGELNDAGREHPELLEEIRGLMEQEHSAWDRVPELGIDWERTLRTRLGWLRRNPQISVPVALALAALGLSVYLRRRRRRA